jgi:hypothetical protein
MSKINLVRVGWTDLNSSYLEWILQTEFDLSVYNNTKTYNKDTDILVVIGLQEFACLWMEEHYQCTKLVLV